MQRYLLPVRWIVKRDRGLEVIQMVQGGKCLETE
jgi:hypothetical protein